MMNMNADNYFIALRESGKKIEERKSRFLTGPWSVSYGYRMLVLLITHLLE